MVELLLTVGLALLLAGGIVAKWSSIPLAGCVSGLTGVTFLVGSVAAILFGWSTAAIAAGAFTLAGIALVALGCLIYFDKQCRILSSGAEQRLNRNWAIGHWSMTLGVLVVGLGVLAHQTVTPVPIWWAIAIGCVIPSWWAVLGTRATAS